MEETQGTTHKSGMDSACDIASQIMVNESRNHTITITKAIGIMLMVLGHVHFYNWGHSFIYMFHMPLFFICTGYCLKDKYMSDFPMYAWRRIKGIWWPFVKWSLFFLVFHNLFCRINLYHVDYGHNAEKLVEYDLNSIYNHVITIITKMYDNDELLAGFWFLHSLFFSSFIAYMFIRIKLPLVGVCATLLLSFLFNYYDITTLSWTITHKEWLAAAFIIVGYIIKIENFKIEWYKIILFFVIVEIASILHPIDMPGVEAVWMLPYAIVAIMGTLMTMGLAEKCTKAPSFIVQPLIYIGDHTIEILTWHLLSFKFVNLLMIWIYNHPMIYLAYFPTIPESHAMPWWLVYFVVGIVVPLFLCATIRKFYTKLCLLISNKYESFCNSSQL